MTQDQKIIRAKVGLLELAKQRCASEPFDLGDDSQVRNELAAAAKVPGGDGADQAGHGPLQRCGSRAGQLVGAVQVASALHGFTDLQAFEDSQAGWPHRRAWRETLRHTANLDRATRRGLRPG